MIFSFYDSCDRCILEQIVSANYWDLSAFEHEVEVVIGGCTQQHILNLEGLFIGAL